LHILDRGNLLAIDRAGHFPQMADGPAYVYFAERIIFKHFSEGVWRNSDSHQNLDFGSSRFL
jgi:hypothetical protein